MAENECNGPRDCIGTEQGCDHCGVADESSVVTASYCECYGDPEDAPLCDECKAEERERDAERAADLFEEDVRLYGI